MAIHTAVVDAQISVTVSATGRYNPLALTVSKFRFKDTTGGETSAAWLAAADTSLVLTAGAYPYVRLRFLVQNNSGTATSDNNALLEYRSVGAYTSEWQDAADSDAFGVIKDSQLPKWETSTTVSAYVYIEEIGGFLAVDSSANVIKRGGGYNGTTSTLGQLTVASGTVKSASFISDGAGGLTALCVYVLTASSTLERLGYSTSSDRGRTWSAVTAIGSMTVAGVDISTPTIIRRTTDSFLQVVVRNDTTMFTVQSTNTTGTTWGAISTFGTSGYAKKQMEYVEGAEKIFTFFADTTASNIIIRLTDWDIATGTVTTKSSSSYGASINLGPDEGVIMRAFSTSTRITIYTIKKEVSGNQPNSEPFLIRSYHSYGFSLATNIYPLQALSPIFMTHETASFISVVDVKELSATSVLLTVSYNEWTDDADAVRLAQIEYNPTTRSIILDSLVLYPLFKNADIPGVTSGSTQAFNMNDFYNQSFGQGITLISDNYRYLTTPVNINYLIIPNYFGAETDSPLVSNANTTQQLGAGTFVSANKGYSRQSIVPANIENRADVVVANASEYEVEFFLDIQGLPTKKKYEFRLTTIPDTQRMLPYRDYDDHDNFKRTGTSSWALTGTFSSVNGPYGSGYTYASFDATGATETLTRSLIVTDPCYYVVAVVSASTTPLATGVSTMKLKVDGATHYTQDMQVTRNALLTTNLLTAGTYTIQVEKIQNHSVDRWVYVNGFTREFRDVSTQLLYGSANTYTHSGDYPSITLNTIATDAESRVTAVVTGRVDSFTTGAFVAQINVTAAVAATLSGNILGAVDAQVTVVAVVAGLTGQVEPGAVAAVVNVTAVVTGTAYRTLQKDFRFRLDDGGEADATWAGAINAGIRGVIPGEVYRVRFSVENTAPTTEANVNRGHLEISDDGGDYFTMGMNDYDTPVISPVHTQVALSTITPSYIDEVVNSNTAHFYIAQDGEWLVAYVGKNSITLVNELMIRISTNGGLTWRKTYSGGTGDVMLVREDTTGAIIVHYGNYAIRSTTGGLSWSSPQVLPVLATSVLNFFVDINNDYILTESKTSVIYHVSTDQGVSWNTYTDTSFPSTTMRSTRVHYELDESSTGLTISFLSMTGTTTIIDPTYLYEYTDASPYSGMPNLADDDAGIRLAAVTTGLSLPWTYITHGFTMRINDDDGLVLAGGLLTSVVAGGGLIHTFIVKTPSGYVSTPTLESEFIPPANFMSPLNRAYQGRDMVFRGERTKGFFLQSANMNGITVEPYRTPGFMGYQTFDSFTPTMSFSPKTDAWYKVKTDGDIIIYEMRFSGLVDGEHTTQQISSGTFKVDNYGSTHFNTIHGSAGIDIPAGDTVEYEYAFSLTDAANIEGKVICMRPSGFGGYSNPACFTVPYTETLASSVVTAVVSGDTDGPHTYPTVTVTANVAGAVNRNGAASGSAVVTAVVAGRCSKEAVAVAPSSVEAYAYAWVLHPAQSLAAVNVTATVGSTNIKTGASVFASTVNGVISEPVIYVPGKTLARVNVTAIIGATKEVTAKTKAFIRVQAAVRDSTTELCVSLNVYQRQEKLRVVRESALTVVDIPATITVVRSPKPDLVLIKPLPLNVYVGR